MGIKKIKSLIIVSVIALAALFSLSSCVSGEKYYTKEDVESLVSGLEEKIDALLSKHEHTFGEWVDYVGNQNVYCESRLFYRICSECSGLEWKTGSYKDHLFNVETVKPTCVSVGYDERTCTICSKQEKINEKGTTGHEWDSAYSSDSSFHWLDCIYCDETASKGEHSISNSGYCPTCDKPISSTVGILYEVSADGSYATVMGYSGPETRIILANEYNGIPVTNIYSGAFKNSSITSVVIPEGITSIGASAFASCYSLKNVTMADSVTEIGAYAFRYCCNLSEITIPNNVTEIYSSTFENCSALKSVFIPESVTVIEAYAFYNCSNLTSVTISDSATSLNIDLNAFTGCHNDLYTEYEYGKYIGNETNPYAVLGEITNKNLNTYKINEATRIIANNAFTGCSRLTDIEIPDSVTMICSSAFSDCESLKNVSFGDGVKKLGSYVFSGCISLISITIPDSINEIGTYAFQNCSNLKNITISDSITSISSYAFSGCVSLTTLTLGNNVTKIGSSAFCGCEKLVSVTLGSSVAEIGDNAFLGCYKLTEVINKSALEIKVGFVTNGYVGYYAIEVHNGESKLINYEDYLFYTSYNGVNYLIAYIGEDKEIELPNSYNREKYEIYKNAFKNCNDITGIKISDSVTAIGENAFANCAGLKKIDTGNGVVTIGDYAFSGCQNLKNVTIGKCVNLIGKCAFEKCSSLNYVNFAIISNWFASKNISAVTGTKLNLTQQTMIIKYLTSTYLDYYLKRSN